MEPREVDRQVAEKVMGWEIVREGEDCWWKDANPFYCNPEDFNPSTNIAHAIEALESEKLRGTMRLTISGRKKYVNFSCWCPETENRGEATIHLSQGYTLETATAMAICLAALEAVGKKK